MSLPELGDWARTVGWRNLRWSNRNRIYYCMQIIHTTLVQMFSEKHASKQKRSRMATNSSLVWSASTDVNSNCALLSIVTDPDTCAVCVAACVEVGTLVVVVLSEPPDVCVMTRGTTTATAMMRSSATPTTAISVRRLNHCDGASGFLRASKKPRWRPYGLYLCGRVRCLQNMVSAVCKSALNDEK